MKSAATIVKMFRHLYVLEHTQDKDQRGVTHTFKLCRSMWNSDVTAIYRVYLWDEIPGWKSPKEWKQAQELVKALESLPRY